MIARTLDRLTIEADLRHALTRNSHSPLGNAYV